MFANLSNAFISRHHPFHKSNDINKYDIIHHYKFSNDKLRQSHNKDSPMVIMAASSFDASSNPIFHNPNTKTENGTPNEGMIGKLKKIKQREAKLSKLLTQVRLEKLATLRSFPLRIGIIGFGRFGQFIGSYFRKYSDHIVVTSQSDYTDLAEEMDMTYIPLNDPKAFVDQNLDVIVIATSILSFDDTVKTLSHHLNEKISQQKKEAAGGHNRSDEIMFPVVGPLIVDVLSVKEHPREILLEHLPNECDILCTHPMFGPDSGKNGWQGLTFVYERTRIHGAMLESEANADTSYHPLHWQNNHTDHDISNDMKKEENSLWEEDEADDIMGTFLDEKGIRHTFHEESEAYLEGMDRMERFLSIWEEEGCRMIPLSCKNHDTYAANSQFITHLTGRILGDQGLKQTPIDTKGFESVLKLVGTTTADSFDLFYGLYKYNRNSMDTIKKLQESMENVVGELKRMEMERDEWN